MSIFKLYIFANFYYIFLQYFSLKTGQKINNRLIAYFEKNQLHDLRILDGEISIPKSRNLMVDEPS